MLEWEEHTFLGLKSLYERFVSRPRERAIAAVRVELDGQRQRLFLLAQMAAGRPVSIFETDEAVLCDNEHIFLPPAFAGGESREANLGFYEIKTLVGGLAIQQGWTGDANLSDWMPRIGEAFPRLPEKIQWVSAAFESPERFWNLLGDVRASGETKESDSIDGGARNREDSEGENDVVEEEITEIQGRGQLDVRTEAEPEDDGPGHEMPIHTFEKAETLEEHSGLSRRTDEDDELRDHEEALQRVNMNHVLRSRERPRSIYRADVLMESLTLEADDSRNRGGIPYPEWDFKKRLFRENWCRVREGKVEAGDPEWIQETLRRHRGLVLRLKKLLANLAHETLRSKRRPSGPEFDIDALIENRVAWHTGHTPDENVYLEKRRQLHDVGVLVLLDRSYSTDGYIDERRVLDLIRETMICTGEVLDDFIDEFAVAAFSSDTRHHCAFDLIKTFEESWALARSRLGSIAASGYTRIGPALRHAQEKLKRRHSERKVVILITDGRPCDYDRYEGSYGVQDVKHAVAAGRNHGIDTHAFAIETRARETFPAMFTPDHFHVVPKPEALTDSLCDLFARLKVR